MGCGGCRGKGNRHSKTADLKKFAYLTPRQLRYLKSLEGDIDSQKEDDSTEEGNE